MNRRKILQLGVAFGSAGLAGCTQYFPANQVRIGEAAVGNRDSERGHTIRVVVEFNGEVAYDEVHEFEKMRNNVAPAVDFTDDLPKEPGEFLIKAYLDGSAQPEVMDVSAVAPSDCTFVSIIAESTNRVSLMYSGDCNGQIRERMRVD
ncbi:MULTISPECIES: hypothetical protein [unclassified Haladaptatus]|uniref:hypothetical protein n=1 Tax=unclassified Haladaptatus TaxID=2622732 RepID=UPI0023E8DFE6|nr:MULTISPECIES: hypothetical protein [unclassified Haladaptatus]